MAVHRIGIIKNKKSNGVIGQRREVATLLEQGKDEKARIRVEGIIRDDFTVEAYEVLELLCELVAERANLIHTERECPYDMREAVCTLIWAANRTEVPELLEVKKQLTKKYGQDFAASAIRNVDGCVNERVMEKLGVQPPSAYLVVNYLKEIANNYGVQWEEDEEAVQDPLAPTPAPSGTSVTSGAVSGPGYASVYSTTPQQHTHEHTLPPQPAPSFHPSASGASSRYTPSETGMSEAPSIMQPQVRPPPPPSAYENSSFQQSRGLSQSDLSQSHASNASSRSNAGENAAPAARQDSVPDFDELTARFERLKQQRADDNASFTF